MTVPVETFDSSPSPSVLVIGDPVGGIRIVGPFATAQWAADYAERHPALRNVTWWVTEIAKPEVLA
jgi:hypothetical protein